MHLRYRFAMSLVALCLALACAPAMASAHKTASPPVNQGPLPAPTSTQGTAADCDALGSADGGTGGFIWFFPSNDYYYQYFDPSTCCPDGVNNFTVHWVQLWRASIIATNPTCHITVQSWIVKSEAGPGGTVGHGDCAIVPATGDNAPSGDPSAAETLCGPSAIVTLLPDPAGVGNYLIDHSWSQPACACINTPAFILVKIIESNGCPLTSGALATPDLWVDQLSDPCISFNGYGPPNGGTWTLPFDLTDVDDGQGGSFATGNLQMWLEADCCTVKALPSTWGKVKTLYR